MLRRIGSHIRNQLIGTVALFLVLTGGTAMAVDGSLPGQNTVGSSDIINGEVTTEDLGASSVASGKITDGQVKAVDLSAGATNSATTADNSLESIDVKNETLGSKDVTNESLTGSEIQNQSLSGAEIDSSLTGANLLDGFVGEEDLAEDAAFNDVTVVNSQQVTANQGQDMEVRALCPLGWDVSGGGYDAFISGGGGGAGNDGDIAVGRNRPFGRTVITDQAHWYVHARNVGGIGVGTAFLTAYAICVR